ncbi:MAG TPA: acVLRF1 family peptidyl-tRNA hydrolase [Actinomycetes bacterium]|nr:acVLRF1 family peptidyl-tRNA hydrolase [Actinomycetes bacterium]
MSSARGPARRRVTVEAERLAGWLDRFAGKHGPTACEAGPDAVVVRAEDGSVARLTVPFPPLVAAGTTYGGIVEHALRDRRVGVLLVRLGGFAAGVFDGTSLVSSKVGSRQVHGRSAAGGWSQQRFARRREGQVRVALAAAADVAAAVLLPETARLDAVVLGGDRRSVEPVLEDRRLAPLRPLVTGPVLDVPDPRLAVLRGTPAAFRAVQVEVTDVLRPG